MNALVSLGVACGILLVVSAFLSPQLFSLKLPKRRINKVAIPAEVWPDAVDDVASAIRAGLSLPQAVCELSNSSASEISKEFGIVASEYLATGNFVQALKGLRQRQPDLIVEKFVNALTIAYEVGGNDLGVMLRTLAEVIREDVKLRGEVHARQSWTVNGARLAVAAPWVTVLLLSSRADAAQVYQSAAGIRILGLCAAVSVVAYSVMQRIARLPEGSI
jgi:tight adherence protein B